MPLRRAAKWPRRRRIRPTITATPSSSTGSRRFSILVPRRPLAFVFLVLTGAGLIAAVECLYAWMPDLAAALAGPAGSPPSNWANRGAWGAGFLFVGGLGRRRNRVAGLSGPPSSQRRLPRPLSRLALGRDVLVLLAADLSTGLRDGFRDAMILATGARVAGDGSIWWAIAYALLFGSIGTRLLMDMWPCRLSVAALGLAACGYVAAAPAHFGWWSFGAVLWAS